MVPKKWSCPKHIVTWHIEEANESLTLTKEVNVEKFDAPELSNESSTLVLTFNSDKEHVLDKISLCIENMDISSIKD